MIDGKMVLIWIYALIGLIPIMVTLLGTGHAVLHAIGVCQDFGCPDCRVEKTGLVFGGSAAFTFGWYYFVLAKVVADPGLQALFIVYGQLHLVASLIQTAGYLTQVVMLKRQGKLTKELIELKAHWGDKYGRRGCGFTIAMNPLCWLYWLALTTKPKTVWGNVVGVPRDLITLIDYLASLPATFILFVLVRLFTGIWVFPTLRSVDREG